MQQYKQYERRRYYTLGIIRQEDADKGIMEPFYILCQAHGTALTRGQWRVIKKNLYTNDWNYDLSRVLVTNPEDHPAMELFMQNYRTRDHMHGDKNYTHQESMKYYPKGWLCWFRCGRRGALDGYFIVVCHLPIPKKKRVGSVSKTANRIEGWNVYVDAITKEQNMSAIQMLTTPGNYIVTETNFETPYFNCALTKESPKASNKRTRKPRSKGYHFK